MKVKAYQIPDTSPQYLATSIESWFRSENFETQSFAGPENTYIVQGRKDNLLRYFLGLSAALTVTVGTQPDGALTVAIGAGSWFDKFLAGFAGVFLFAPLAFTAVYGVWKQDNLENKLWDYISQRLPGAVEVPVTIPDPQFHPVRLTPS
ncbi:hypothetical protein [Gloeobacter kilaueensis]|uniref:Uncharacterized protein n=1 Tax=Gloeobacter kilaueensis (strain ATCC BAA-2537 / CCAP 1431/1 / ULC 316 / JS1) TaxID=1183438 RepID=U5QJR7_GLOK1|nr:hypothetical protein [Gloeobacter kilaueensis]AGY59237.1 hypothetical protein GKIL_2991 [Gloeobacter kilaueensis JS1]